MKRVKFAFCVVFLVAGNLFGQGTPTATLSGKVTAERVPVPGVTVSVTSPNLQGTRTAVTTETGDYIIPFLPAGPYTVTYELAGMAAVTKKLTLTVARTEVADVDMKPAAVAESITVTADAPVTATLENTAVSTNINQQEFFEKLPLLRNLTNITLLAPGTSQNEGSFGIMVSGSFSFDNMFMINGAIVGENLRGQPHGLFIEDAIQETTVLTGAVPAEYGHFTGGVINAITKSGGNDFSGSVRDSVTSEAWNGKTPFTIDQSDTVNHTYEGTMGGPVMRDRLWFFGAGRYLKTSDLAQTNKGVARAGDQTAAGVPIPVGTPLGDITFPTTDKQVRLEGKLTGTIGARHTFMASYVDVARTLTNTSDASELDLSVVNAEETNPNTLLVLDYNGVVTNSLFVEAQFSRKEFAFLGSGARCYELLCGTRISDRARGASYNSPVFRFKPEGEQRNHKTWFAKGGYFLSSPRFGSHDIKAGYENFFEVRDVNNWQGGSEYTLDIASTMIRGDQKLVRIAKSA